MNYNDDAGFSDDVVKINIEDSNNATPEPPLHDPQICSTCSKEWHESIDCELLKPWLKKCAEEANASPTAESERFHRYYNLFVKHQNCLNKQDELQDQFIKCCCSTE